MPQIQLPVFPASSTAITSELAFEQRDGQVYYFNGHLPVFTRPAVDIASFRFFTSQLVANGSVSQDQISRAFGVPLITVKRACKKLRLEGAAAFFRPTPPRQGHKLTPEILAQAQALLDEGMEVPDIGELLGVLPNTQHKAISFNRLKKRSRPTESRHPGLHSGWERAAHHPKRPQRRGRPSHHGRCHHPAHGPRRRRHGHA
jgi:hypothetical protein